MNKNRRFKNIYLILVIISLLSIFTYRMPMSIGTYTNSQNNFEVFTILDNIIYSEFVTSFNARVFVSTINIFETSFAFCLLYLIFALIRFISILLNKKDTLNTVFVFSNILSLSSLYYYANLETNRMGTISISYGYIIIMILLLIDFIGTITIYIIKNKEYFKSMNKYKIIKLALIVLLLCSFMCFNFLKLKQNNNSYSSFFDLIAINNNIFILTAIPFSLYIVGLFILLYCEIENKLTIKNVAYVFMGLFVLYFYSMKYQSNVGYENVHMITQDMYDYTVHLSLPLSIYLIYILTTIGINIFIDYKIKK